jgi:hypothetical protein
MSLADSALQRDEWIREAIGAINLIYRLRQELDTALRKYPPVDAAWRIVDADLRCIEARDQLRMAIERVRQIS